MTRSREYDRSPLHENRVFTTDLRLIRVTRRDSICHTRAPSADRDHVLRNGSNVSSESGVTFQSSRKVTPVKSMKPYHGCSESSMSISALKQVVGAQVAGVECDSDNGSQRHHCQLPLPSTDVLETFEVFGAGQGATEGSGSKANDNLVLAKRKAKENPRKRKWRSSSHEISHKRRHGNDGDERNDSSTGKGEHVCSGTKCLEDDDNGYLIMKPGQLINDYQIAKVIGEGAFGRVAECSLRENRSTENQKVMAIKVIRKSEKYTKMARMEIRVIKTLMQLDPHRCFSFVSMFDSFQYRDHVCIVFEKLGSNLYDFQKANRHAPYPPHHVQAIAYQLISAVRFMHSYKLIHTDLKPENILFVNDEYDEKFDESRGHSVRVLRCPKIRIIDFGSSTFESQYHSRIVSTRHYRAPEVILELNWSYPCDVWSIGCIVFEAFTGVALFMTHDNMEHLAMIERALGQRISYRLVKRTHKRRYFHHGRLDWNIHSRMGRYVRDHTRNITRYFDDNRRSDRYLFKLTRDLLACHPDDRITLRSAVRHRYFDDDVLNNPILRELKEVTRKT